VHVQLLLCWQYRTERNGVVETHIEKRTRIASVPEEHDEIDHDKVRTQIRGDWSVVTQPKTCGGAMPLFSPPQTGPDNPGFSFWEA